MLDQTKIVVVTQGELIPFDGKVTDGLAFVDESAVAGVSTPVLIDSQSGRDEVIAGGVVVDGWLKIESHSPKATAETPVLAKTKNASLSVPEPVAPTSNSRVLSFLALALCAIVSAMLFALIGYATMHSEIASFVSGVVGLIAGSYEGCRLLKRIRQSREDGAVLRHTISVNLSILLAELDELSVAAAKAKASPETTTARALLSSAAGAAQATQSRLSSASNNELGNMLEQVFQAMLQSTEALRLLGGCSPARVNAR